MDARNAVHKEVGALIAETFAISLPLSRRESAALIAIALQPGDGEQDDRHDERADSVLDVDLVGVRLEAREERRKAAGWNQPVDEGDHQEDQRPESRR